MIESLSDLISIFMCGIIVGGFLQYYLNFFGKIDDLFFLMKKKSSKKTYAK